MNKLVRYALAVMAGMAITSFAFVSAQTEVMAWGNMTGIRIEGEWMEFESSFRVVDHDWQTFVASGKEKQSRPFYHREGESQLVRTTVGGVIFEQTVTDEAPGQVSVSLKAVSDTSRQAEGAFFCIDLPLRRYAGGSLKAGNTEIPFASLESAGSQPKKLSAATFRMLGNGRSLTFRFPGSVTAFIRKEKKESITLYFQWMGDRLKKGNQIQRSFTIHAEGEIDHSPALLTVDADHPGRLFEGLGGNFRLQNPKVDPKVIDYCLSNLRIAWGRVEMPWRLWHPEEGIDPLAEARAGRTNDRVQAAIDMARRLKALGMPVIVSAWFPPVWAIDGDPARYVRRGGVQAYRLDPTKKEKIYKSITDYLVYLKQTAGVEAFCFSFNESDLGIDVLHTPEEHAEFIKGLGAFMASQGLATKVLLGDNSDATTFDFIVPAMEDAETHTYIGAVSFHSWRGCDDETLRKWGAAARKLNVPLLIGEGSTDAAAHTYPEIFHESTFAFYEINLYIRICALSQPLSILQWQLTSDYSVLWGDGVYGSDGPLRPTQRFWNLKQLASTPEQAFSLPVVCDKEAVNCAAFGNIATGKYAVHLVNNGASRPVTLQGLPETDGGYQIYVTNRRQGMEHTGTAQVVDGKLTIDLPAYSFVSLINP